MIRISDTIFENFIKGKESAFDEIFKQYYRTLVFFSTKHGLELTEAEDVVMDTFHKVWQMRKDILSAAAMNTLLFTLTHNRTLNVIRNLKNRQNINAGLGLKDLDEGFESAIMEDEILRILDDAIANLPNQCKEVVLLYLSGKSVSEIAETMNLSVNTIKTHKTRAILNLRKVMDKEPDKNKKIEIYLLISILMGA